ncbi:unnamed protein product [Moneuplotes crassus]|uniref:Uncharacterized protein n=1 Tax=Euplotes crassus TaxID=5936 RepID=A0AAD1XYD4_EUPCR|nr:unnamed protein product [Moneuplotes crassus]
MLGFQCWACFGSFLRMGSCWQTGFWRKKDIRERRCLDRKRGNLCRDVLIIRG